MPNAMAAIAPAPPMANNRSTLARLQAARTAVAGRPSGCGGEQTITSLTPATRAGMAHMSTLLGYTARPPGA